MIKRLPAWSRVTIAAAGVLILGVVDWLTGYDLNFFVFYFLPISFGAWFLGVGYSIILAVLSALVWFGADFLSGHQYSSHFFAVWNTFIRFVSFLAIGWSVSMMRRALDRERETSEDLRRSLSKVRVLEAFIPICAQCKKIRNQQGIWQQLEAYFRENSSTQFSHGYCPECAKKLIEEARLIVKKTEP
jgi:hypothetical protein